MHPLMIKTPNHGRILHLTSMYPTNINGIHSGGHAVYDVVESIEKLIGPGRQDVLFFSSFLLPYYWLWDSAKKDTRDLLNPPWKDYLRFKRIPKLPYIFDGGITSLLWQNFWPVSFFKNNNYSLIHIHTTSVLGCFGVRLARRLKIPSIVTARIEVQLFRGQTVFIRNIIEHAITGADEVIAPSVGIANSVRELFGRETALIPNGTNQIFNIPPVKHSAREKHSILFTGVLENRKGLLPLMDACARLKKDFPSLKLYIAGRGPLENEVIKRANENPSFTYLSWLTQEDLLSWMDRCEILCVPSYTETFGIVYAEAMKRGMVVVARKGTGIDGMGVDGRDYVLINGDEDLQPCLGRLLNDQGKNAAMALRGGELAKLWSWDNNARLHLELYLKHGA